MMKKKEKKNKIFLLLMAIVFAISFLIPTISSVNVYASTCSDEVKNLDQTRVMEDLLSCENFDILKYPFDQSEDKMVVINFVEYCYSYKLDMQDNYNLYLYIYNPQGIEIDTIKTNKVQIAVEFDEENNPINYEKFNLEYCDRSQGDYAELFYKFKISDTSIFLTKLNSLKRTYHISGIELNVANRENATEYNVSTSYSFTGYAKGFGGDSEESTLKCEANAIETLTLDVKHSYYRFDSDGMEERFKGSQINSVYFSVPNSIIEKYGSIYSVKAEFWEYATKDIFITSSSKVYNSLKDYIGVNIAHNSGDVPDCAVLRPGGFWTTVGAPLYTPYKEWLEDSFIYNADSDYALNTLNEINYLFLAEDIVGDYTLKSEDLSNYIYNYSIFKNGTIDCNGREISADLFLSEEEFNAKYYNTSTATSDRKMGYNKIDITVEDNIEITKLNESASWWETFFTVNTIEDKTIAPIKSVTSDEVIGSDSKVSENLLIAKNDVDDFREYLNNATENEETVFLFRFAETDYLSYSNLQVSYEKRLGDFYFPATDYAMSSAHENVFLDFDIIQLTLTNDAMFYTIPVVSSPFDIISDVDVTLEDKSLNTFTWILIAIVILICLLAIPFLKPILKLLFKGVVWIVSLPIQLLLLIFGFYKKGNKRRKVYGKK